MREVISVLAAVALLWPAAATAEGSSVDAGVWPGKGAASVSTPSRARPSTSAVGTSDQSVGSFRHLSPGNQQIAEALFNSQSVGAGPRQAWSLDRIAAVKESGVGWGTVFQRMQADGLIKERNLGTLLSDSRRPASPAAPGRSTVIVTGAGKVYVAGAGRSSSGRPEGAASGRRTAEERSVDAPKPRQVAQTPKKRPQGDGRGWIAAGSMRGGNPAVGLSTASASQALNRSPVP